MIILKRVCISHVIKYKTNDCYLVSSKNLILIINEIVSSNNIRVSFKELLIMIIKISASETKLFNRIIMYDSEDTTIMKQIKTVIINYS